MLEYSGVGLDRLHCTKCTTNNVMGILMHIFFNWYLELIYFSGCKGLFQDFMQIMKSFPSGNQSFSLLQGYEKTCREQVTMLKKTFRGATRDSV